jgi:intracellular septation protein
LVHDAALLAAPGTLSVLRSLNFRTTTISRMKLLIDFFPIILFFVAFKVWGIYTATAVAIVATVAQIAYLRFKTGKIEPMQWMSLGVIVLFGGATLLAHDDNFIKWKPTVLYWLMGGALLIGQLVFKRTCCAPSWARSCNCPTPSGSSSTGPGPHSSPPWADSTSG